MSLCTLLQDQIYKMQSGSHTDQDQCVGVLRAHWSSIFVTKTLLLRRELEVADEVQMLLPLSLLQ